jgi:hypothetical protein
VDTLTPTWATRRNRLAGVGVSEEKRGCEPQRVPRPRAAVWPKHRILRKNGLRLVENLCKEGAPVHARAGNTERSRG